MRRMARPLTLLAAASLVLAGCGTLDDGASGGGGPAAGGGGGVDGTVRMARASWDTGWMQAEITRQLLEELGYTVTDPADATRDAATFYPALARGDLDLWVNGWFPLHDRYLDSQRVTGQSFDEPIELVGTQVPTGAVQGFLVDRATAEELGITSMADLAAPDVAATFDADGDGQADLIGCDEGWGCHLAIDEHIEAADWGANVEQVSGDYASLVRDAADAIADGEPTLLYTWTPSWTLELLGVGEDVVWLEAPALPDQDLPTTVEGLEGCATGADGCDLGWPVNDIRGVANEDFLADNPRVRVLLEQVRIPLADIVAQNARMAGAEDYTREQVVQDATGWIEANRGTVDEWLTAARDA